MVLLVDERAELESRIEAMARKIDETTTSEQDGELSSDPDDSDDPDLAEADLREQRVATERFDDLSSEVDELTQQMDRVLGAIVKSFEPGAIVLSGDAQAACDAWSFYIEATTDLSRTLTPEDEVSSIAKQQSLWDRFDSHFVRLWGNTIGTCGFYYHYCRRHLASDRHRLWASLGVGIKIASTSASEHGNKFTKRDVLHLHGFNKGLKNKFFMIMRDNLIRLLRYPGTFLTLRHNKPYTYSRCRAALRDPSGHTRRSSDYPLYFAVAA